MKTNLSLRLISLILLLCVIIGSLAACGDKTGADNNDNNEPIHACPAGRNRKLDALWCGCMSNTTGVQVPVLYPSGRSLGKTLSVNLEYIPESYNGQYATLRTWRLGFDSLFWCHTCRLSSVGRAPVLQTGCRRFEPVSLHQYAAQAHMVCARAL